MVKSLRLERRFLSVQVRPSAPLLCRLAVEPHALRSRCLDIKGFVGSCSVQHLAILRQRHDHLHASTRLLSVVAKLPSGRVLLTGDKIPTGFYLAAAERNRFEDRVVGHGFASDNGSRTAS